MTDRIKNRERSSWSGAIQRCTNPNTVNYQDYGGRGITICNRWRHSFANFLADMGPCPPKMTIDRINNDGNYEPGNCRWADRKTQARNHRRNRRVTAFGERKTVADWADDPRCLITAKSIIVRLNKGMTPEEAIASPPEDWYGQAEHLAAELAKEKEEHESTRAKFRELQADLDRIRADNPYWEVQLRRANQHADAMTAERDAALAQVSRVESLTAYIWRDAEPLRLSIRKCLAANRPAKGA